MKKNILSLVVLTLLALSGTLSAQISPTITVQGTNATVRWASTPGESYTVLHRRAFHEAFPWTIIATNLPASDEAETVFQHLGGVPLVPAGYTGGGSGGGGGMPGSPASATLASPAGDPMIENKDDKVKKDGGFPSLPTLPDEKEIEKWLKEMLKEYERRQREGGSAQPVPLLMSSAISAGQAANTSMGFYIVLEGASDANGDGVPDGWSLYYGFDPFEDQTTVDSDGDGATNAEEYYAGSNPLNPIGLPGVAASLLSERSATTNSLDGGMFHDEFRFEWGVGAWATNRYVFLFPYVDPATSETQTGTTAATVWPWQVAQLKPGTQTTWTDLQGGGQANIVVTTNIALPTGPYQGSWRNGVIDGITNISKVDFISTGTNSSLKRVYEVNFSGYSGTNSATMQPITNFTGISVAGQNLNTNGRCWVVIGDNSRTNFTPGFAGAATNVSYTMTVARVEIQLTFRKAGLVTKSDAVAPVGIGYQANLRASLVVQFGEQLGGPYAALKPQFNLNGLHNTMEMNATIPAEMPLTGWKWHRDAAAKRFIWNATTKQVVPVQVGQDVAFSGAPPGNGSDTPPDDVTIADPVPDANLLIVDADAPTVSINTGVAADSIVAQPVGSLVAMRFFAREWVTWNGGLVSEIKPWHSLITARLVVDNGQPTLDLNNLPNSLAETPAGVSEVPLFRVGADGNPF